MLWDETASEIEKKKAALDEEFKSLLESLMRDYFAETEKRFSFLSKELKDAKKFDIFGNDITPEGKEDEVWEYFAEKNLWENIFNKNYKTKQDRYLNRLEEFLSETVDSPDRHLEFFGRGLLWRYYAKLDEKGQVTFVYIKTDDPLDPLARTAKVYYQRLSASSQDQSSKKSPQATTKTTQKSSVKTSAPSSGLRRF